MKENKHSCSMEKEDHEQSWAHVVLGGLNKANITYRWEGTKF